MNGGCGNHVIGCGQATKANQATERIDEAKLATTNSPTATQAMCHPVRGAPTHPRAWTDGSQSWPNAERYQSSSAQPHRKCRGQPHESLVRTTGEHWIRSRGPRQHGKPWSGARSVMEADHVLSGNGLALRPEQNRRRSQGHSQGANVGKPLSNHARCVTKDEVLRGISRPRWLMTTTVPCLPPSCHGRRPAILTVNVRPCAATQACRREARTQNNRRNRNTLPVDLHA